MPLQERGDHAYIGVMTTFLVILLVLAMAGALFSIVRGIVIFLKTSHEDVTGTGPSVSGLRQNKMMWRRIQFQAAAVLIAVLLLLMARGGSG